MPTLIGLLVLQACAFSDLQFRTDERVRILTPRPLEEVRLPVRVTWEVTGFRVTGADGRRRRDAGYFGVYVDQRPQPPGQTVSWFARRDRFCRGSTACSDRSWFHQRGIYWTGETSFVVEAVVPPSRHSRRADLHEVTIALLDGDGRRIGESAFAVRFEVVRDRRP